MSNQENNLKEIKKTRRRKSQRKAQQIKLAVIMIMVSVLVLSASTFAWYQLNNTAKITNMQFTADTMGNLLIAPEEGGKEGTYGHELDLELNNGSKKLLPATANSSAGKNGIEDFFSPTYAPDGKSVTTLTALTDNTYEKYVYKKVFYIKSGETKDTGNQFALMLDAGSVTNSVWSGTYVKDLDTSDCTAANAIRISFVIESTGENSSVIATKVYEPNYDGIQSGDDTTSATYTGTDTASYGNAAYSTLLLQQSSSGAFTNDTNTTLCTLDEGVPVRITMYVWIEGQDDQCVSEIALDNIGGQIQFVAQ